MRYSRTTRPLLVSGQYGGGRTIFFGFDGTWRWRPAGRNAEYFNRFWLQTVRFLVEGRAVLADRDQIGLLGGVNLFLGR